MKGEYSIYSDVFAFGILMWEIASRSSRPFQGVQEVVIPTLIQKGNRPEIANDCPIEIKNLIEQCWNQEAKQRPTMEQVVERLEKLNAANFSSNFAHSLQSGAKYHSNFAGNLGGGQTVSKQALLKQKMWDYLSKELKVDQDDIDDVIDVFVTEKITVKQLEEADSDELNLIFDKLKIMSGVQMRITKAIAQSKLKVLE